jgi:hypothetical protein
VTGSRTATGVGDDNWDTVGGVKGGGGVEGGKIGQPDGAKPNFTAIRVSRRRGYSAYT